MLKLEDLKVGMRVNMNELDKVYETAIILSDLRDGCGSIYYIGELNTAEMSDVYAMLISDGKRIRSVYNLHEADEVDYDE